MFSLVWVRTNVLWAYRKTCQLLILAALKKTRFILTFVQQIGTYINLYILVHHVSLSNQIYMIYLPTTLIVEIVGGRRHRKQRRKMFLIIDHNMFKLHDHEHLPTALYEKL